MNRISDFGLWEKARAANTIDSYQKYLAESSNKSFQKEANEQIVKINAMSEWDSIIDTNSIPLLKEYITKYPSSPYINSAQYRYHVLTAESYYESKNDVIALQWSNAAEDYAPLSGIYKAHYNELNEKSEFEKIKKSADIETVRAYLNGLSGDSPYYTEVSNYLALLLGAQLSIWSSEYDMNQALFYAKDKATETKVKAYVDEAKRLQRLRNASIRRTNGLTRFTFGWNLFHADYFDSILSFGSGIRFRIGSWDIDDDYYWRDSSFFSIGHVIDVPVGLRLNFANTGAKSKFYIGCNAILGYQVGEANDYKGDLRSSSIAIEPQIGIAGRYMDFGIYYRKYFNGKSIFYNKLNYSDQKIGLFLTWYM